MFNQKKRVMESNNQIINSSTIRHFDYRLVNDETYPTLIFNQIMVTQSKIKSQFDQTSTRFGNSARFSLEQLLINKRKLNAFQKLTPGWNGYEGESFNPQLIEMIQKILPNLDYQPQLFPTGRGTIQLEEKIDDNNFLEIEISTSEVFAYLVKDGIEKELIIQPDEINQLILELYD
jgi:hypothetical protein